MKESQTNEASFVFTQKPEKTLMLALFSHVL